MTRTDILLDGVLAIDKPRGPTSHDVVAIVRRSLRTRRVGHTGTLDPFASGLMLVCIGTATRIAEYLTGFDKTYDAAVRLGVATDTDDDTGNVLRTADAGAVARADIERVMTGMRGDIVQMPPQYSAKKVDGERAYRIARSGARAAVTPVPVRIGELEITSFDPPSFGMRVRCSSGTYIRAIARDIGEALGVGAHLTALRRTAVGAQGIDSAVSLDTVRDDPQTAAAHIVASLDALAGFRRLDIDAEELDHVRHGRTIAAPVQDGVVAVAHENRLVAIGLAAAGVVQPKKVLV